MRNLDAEQFTLPKLPGVTCLSVEEVRNDLRELQNNDDDTDSDCSVLSKDILSSIYPVKPRSYRKVLSKDAANYSRRQDGEYENTGGAVFDEALAFIKNVHINYSALYAQELEREKLENTSKWYEESLATDKKAASLIRSEEENYIKAMQGLYVRSLKYQHALSEQNMMIQRLYRALKDRREATETLDGEIDKVKSLLSTKRGNKAVASTSGVSHLKVHLNHDDSDVVIFVGQTVNTPYGKGTIESIDSTALTVSIKLPFGNMSSHISRVVCWCDWNIGTDGSSETSLIQHYDSVHASSLLSIPWAEKLAIRELVSAIPTEDESGTVTDKEDNDNESESDSPSDDEDGDSDSVQSQTNEIAEFISHIGDTAQSSNHNSTSSNVVVSSASVFPMVNNVPAAHSRRETRNKLVADRAIDMMKVSSENLQLAFAPPAALPHILASSASKTPKNSVKYELSALEDSSSVPLGSSGSLCFSGDVANLRSSLQNIGNQIAQLRANNSQLAGKMNYNRASSARIAADATALRVGMFTRRIVHRNALGSAGAVYGAPSTHVPNVEVKSENDATLAQDATDTNGMDVVKQEDVTVKDEAAEADYLSSTSQDEVLSSKKRENDDKDDSPVENKKKTAKRTRRSY